GAGSSAAATTCTASGRATSTIPPAPATACSWCGAIRYHHLVRGERMTDRPSFPRHAFIAGQWVDTKRTFPVRNPATGETLAEVSDCGADEARRAAEAAVEAFPSWKARPGSERTRVLRRWHDLIVAEGEQVARAMTLEMGKPILESRGEARYAATFVDYYAESARRI